MNAREIRIQYLKQAGCRDSDIEESLLNDPPVDAQQELDYIKKSEEEVAVLQKIIDDILNPARDMRIKWMTEYGIPEDEIQECLEIDPPVNLAEETSQLEAVHKIKKLNASGLDAKIKKLMDDIKKENGYTENYMLCLRCRKAVEFDDDGNAYCDHLDERPKK